MDIFKKALRDERGATTVEYALFAGFMSSCLLLAANVVGTNMSLTFDRITDEIVAAAISISEEPADDGGLASLSDPDPDGGGSGNDNDNSGNDGPPNDTGGSNPGSDGGDVGSGDDGSGGSGGGRAGGRGGGRGGGRR